jgi:hypothetical protein
MRRKEDVEPPTRIGRDYLGRAPWRSVADNAADGFLDARDRLLMHASAPVDDAVDGRGADARPGSDIGQFRTACQEVHQDAGVRLMEINHSCADIAEKFNTKSE